MNTMNRHGRGFVAAAWAMTAGALNAFPAAGQIEEEARLLAQGRITSDVLGYGLGFDGTTVIAGAPFGTYGGYTQPGRAFVFFEADDQWAQQRLIPRRIQNNGFFGAAVAIDGDTLAVGAFGETDEQGRTRAGAVYVYGRTEEGWVEVQRLEGAERNETDHFGVRIALDGDTILIGANGADDENGISTGAAYVFERIAGTWIMAARLLAPDRAPVDNFGYAVALDGETGLVAAHRVDVDGVEDAGAVYVLRRTDGDWSVTGRITPDDPQNRGEFGEALALEGDTAAIISTQTDEGIGAVYVYDVSAEGDLVSRVTYAGLGNGGGVSIDGDTIIAGPFLNNGGQGEAIVIRRDAGVWAYEQSFLPAVDRGRLNFGWRLALSGDRAAVSAPFHTTNIGAVYMFRGLGAGGCVRSPEWVCDGDADGDGQVNPVDAGLVQAAFGSIDEQDTCNYDLDCDGQINPVDAGIVQSLFGTCDPPREVCP